MEIVVNEEKGRMRGPKDEEKVTSPLFPRLHVNDTEKGGPRAPPRNKMALYEQLSIPSQRLSSGSASLLPLPPNNGNKLAKSSSQVDDFERGAFTSFCNSPASLHSEKPFSHSFGGVELSTKMASQEQKSTNSSNDRCLKTTQASSSGANNNSFQSHNFSNFNNFSFKKFGEEKKFTVPSCFQSGSVLHCNSSQHSKDQDKPCWNLRFSMHFQDVSEKQTEGTGSIGLKARESIKDQTVQNTKMSEAFQDTTAQSTFLSLVHDKTSDGASSSPSSKFKSIEPLKRVHSSPSQERRSSRGDVLKGLHCINARLDQKFVPVQDKAVHKDNFLVKSAGGIGKDLVSKVRHESCSKLSLGDDNRSHNESENRSRNHNVKQHGPLQVGDVERCDAVSESSMLDSISASDLTPDDVVRVIGEKEFWKARRAIVNQQRIFTVQVFELHRLIEVQKSIAGSPGLLLEDKVYVGKASIQLSPPRKVASENPVERPPLTDKPKSIFQQPYSNTEFADENAAGKPPLPSVNNEIGQGLLTQRSKYVSHSEGALPPIATNTRSSPWCFPPPANQWLVPVMSPSDGLVYKPYSGPCPPTTGFMAPIYGNCGHMRGGDFLNAAYGVSSNPPVGQTYIPPYAMPSISSSAVEQVSPFPYHSSCNMSSQMSHVISCHVEKFQASKESEIQGSTASSPSERLKGDALSFFPTEPTAQASDQNAQPSKPQTHVIKVVPHNPRSATESAARIFQSIQEERKQYN